MHPPACLPNPDNIPAWREHALAYLRDELRDAAPTTLDEPTLFPRSPLEDEGPVAIFPFRANRTGRADESYYVVVGQTAPNYYPASGLSPDEIFSLHLGTRFMLVVGVSLNTPPAQLQSPDSDDYDPRADARQILDRIAPHAALSNVRIAAAFNVESQIHAVLLADINDKPAYILARDAPPGFSDRTDLPPHLIYRLHLGHALRQEPDSSAQE